MEDELERIRLKNKHDSETRELMRLFGKDVSDDYQPDYRDGRWVRDKVVESSNHPKFYMSQVKPIMDKYHKIRRCGCDNNESNN